MLSRALTMPADELLDLLHTTQLRADAASGEQAPESAAPGQPIPAWDPHDLEVHPAQTLPVPGEQGAAGRPPLSAYVPRGHDRVLANLVREAEGGRSSMLALVGTSSTGKTRACWEAVQPLAEQGWRLWHPFDPTRAEAALQDLQQVEPRTVVWLNEAQHYLGDPAVGEQLAAAVHSLLVTPARGPVLVLATLWPEYAARYTALPRPGSADPHTRTRELLSGRTVAVPETFDDLALREAALLADAGDALLADALTRTRHTGRLTQDLAGAPALLARYETGSPAARALLEAAMDARRLGVGLALPRDFLTDAATDYLDDEAYETYDDNGQVDIGGAWAQAALDELAQRVHGRQAPLRRNAPRTGGPPPGHRTSHPPRETFRLADYLEQYGRDARARTCPPASFWHAADRHLTRTTDLAGLAGAASQRFRLQWAEHLVRKAAQMGDPDSMVQLAEVTDDDAGSESLLQRAAALECADALMALARRRAKSKDAEESATLLRQAARAGNSEALLELAESASGRRDTETIHLLCQWAEESGRFHEMGILCSYLARLGDGDGAAALARKLGHIGSAMTLTHLGEHHLFTGDEEAARPLLQEAVDAGEPHAMMLLASLRDPEWKRDPAVEASVIGTGDSVAIGVLATMKQESGDREGARSVLQKAATRYDHAHTWDQLFKLLLEDGAAGTVEKLVREVVESGSADAQFALAELLTARRKKETARTLYEPAAAAGHIPSLAALAALRDAAGDRRTADALYRRIADTGHTMRWEDTLLQRWPHGLDPDGTPTTL
ncbi:hypothetical protein ACFYVL_07255 [Streptomyces sp. NPDC004111]|uniref:hypothetical protein n=1 Tax=Streptomyces sp. NPDC004111 TaxID=3364690 RepID=UPI003693779F